MGDQNPNPPPGGGQANPSPAQGIINAMGLASRIRAGHNLNYGLAKHARIEENHNVPGITMFVSSKGFKGEDKGKLYMGTGMFEGFNHKTQESKFHDFLFLFFSYPNHNQFQILIKHFLSFSLPLQVFWFCPNSQSGR